MVHTDDHIRVENPPESERVLIQTLLERPELAPRPLRKRFLRGARYGVNTALTTDLTPVIANAVAGVATEPANAAIAATVQEFVEQQTAGEASDEDPLIATD